MKTNVINFHARCKAKGKKIRPSGIAEYQLGYKIASDNIKNKAYVDYIATKILFEYYGAKHFQD